MNIWLIVLLSVLYPYFLSTFSVNYWVFLKFPTMFGDLFVSCFNTVRFSSFFFAVALFYTIFTLANIPAVLTLLFLWNIPFVFIISTSCHTKLLVVPPTSVYSDFFVSVGHFYILHFFNDLCCLNLLTIA